MNAPRATALAALCLAFAVVVVGAYVRLSDAGLGCPDWPLCYGNPLPAQIADSGALAKAWKEMGHRYLAGVLGVLLVLLMLFSLRLKQSRGLASAIIALVVVQATLGKWTVTMLLKPAIVTAHLLGGVTILALLAWYVLQQGKHAAAPEARALRAPAAAAIAALAVQIALGGWVSANYAALACLELPLCRGQVVPPMDFANAFHLVRSLGQTADGTLLSNDALTAIHWTHRMFALVVVAVVSFASIRSCRMASLRKMGILIAALLGLQFLLGVANVAFSLPLPLAAAHNAGAAALLLALVVLNFFSFRGLRPSW